MPDPSKRVLRNGCERGKPTASQLIGFYKVDRSRKWFEEVILQIRDAFNRGQLALFDPKFMKNFLIAIVGP